MFFILKSTHDARIALKDQRIAELEADIETLIEQRKMAENLAKQRWNEIQTLEATNADQSAQNQKLFQANMKLATGIPANARAVLEAMSDDWGHSAAQVAANSAVSDKDVRQIIRGFEAYGWAFRHPFFSEDDGLLHGSGYSLTKEGAEMRAALLARPYSTNQVSA